ncbi:unnamed protein product [Closterium sp. NIES-54]
MSKVLMAELTGLEETGLEKWRKVWEEVKILPTRMWTVIWARGAYLPKTCTAQPVTRPVTQHAQPRGAAVCTPARSSRPREQQQYARQCAQHQRQTHAHLHAHVHQPPTRAAARACAAAARARAEQTHVQPLPQPRATTPHLPPYRACWRGGEGEGVTGVTSKPPPATVLSSFLSLQHLLLWGGGGGGRGGRSYYRCRSPSPLSPCCTCNSGGWVWGGGCEHPAAAPPPLSLTAARAPPHPSLTPPPFVSGARRVVPPTSSPYSCPLPSLSLASSSSYTSLPSSTAGGVPLQGVFLHMILHCRQLGANFDMHDRFDDILGKYRAYKSLGDAHHDALLPVIWFPVDAGKVTASAARKEGDTDGKTAMAAQALSASVCAVWCLVKNDNAQVVNVVGEGKAAAMVVGASKMTAVVFKEVMQAVLEAKIDREQPLGEVAHNVAPALQSLALHRVYPGVDHEVEANVIARATVETLAFWGMCPVVGPKLEEIGITVSCDA